jgi:hypothetical protein
LERDFGDVLVLASLGFITYSVKGISDEEMEDLLSLHDDVLKFVFQYATPNIKRIPSHVWLRLKRTLVQMNLIVEGEGGCVVWFHRQLKEVAEAYLNRVKSKCHWIMGHYFGNLFQDETHKAQKIREQGWTLDGHPFDPTSLVNTRRCQEACHLFSPSEMLFRDGRRTVQFGGNMHETSLQ